MKSLLLVSLGGMLATLITLIRLHKAPANPCPNIHVPINLGGNIATYPNTPPCYIALKIPKRATITEIRESAKVLLERYYVIKGIPMIKKKQIIKLETILSLALNLSLKNIERNIVVIFGAYIRNPNRKYGLK